MSGENKVYNIRLDGGQIEEVESFKYLESIIKSTNRIGREMYMIEWERHSYDKD